MSFDGRRVISRQNLDDFRRSAEGSQRASPPMIASADQVRRFASSYFRLTNTAFSFIAPRPAGAGDVHSLHDALVLLRVSTWQTKSRRAVIVLMTH